MHLFVALCFSHPSPPPQIQPGREPPQRKDEGVGGNQTKPNKQGNVANLGRNRLIRGSPEDARGRCKEGSKKRRK